MLYAQRPGGEGAGDRGMWLLSQPVTSTWGNAKQREALRRGPFSLLPHRLPGRETHSRLPGERATGASQLWGPPDLAECVCSPGWLCFAPLCCNTTLITSRAVWVTIESLNLRGDQDSQLAATWSEVRVACGSSRHSWHRRWEHLTENCTLERVVCLQAVGVSSSQQPTCCLITLSSRNGGGGGLLAKSCLTLAIPLTVACQAPLFTGFSRQEHWNGLPFLSPRKYLPEETWQKKQTQKLELVSGHLCGQSSEWDTRVHLEQGGCPRGWRQCLCRQGGRSRQSRALGTHVRRGATVQKDTYGLQRRGPGRGAPRKGGTPTWVWRWVWAAAAWCTPTGLARGGETPCRKKRLRWGEEGPRDGSCVRGWSPRGAWTCPRGSRCSEAACSWSGLTGNQGPQGQCQPASSLKPPGKGGTQTERRPSYRASPAALDENQKHWCEFKCFLYA